LRINDLSLVKVLWRNKKLEAATWEAEEVMRIKYQLLSQIG